MKDNEPVYLFTRADLLFAEIENHQIVLEELLHNQASGSFYDEITKWQNTLQTIEAVLQDWHQVQIKWKFLEGVRPDYSTMLKMDHVLIYVDRLKKVYLGNKVKAVLAQETVAFFKSDKDFRLLMKATKKNNNILKCCQRKSKTNYVSILARLKSRCMLLKF
jgi:dynein heavy chain